MGSGLLAIPAAFLLCCADVLAAWLQGWSAYFSPWTVAWFNILALLSPPYITITIFNTGKQITYSSLLKSHSIIPSRILPLEDKMLHFAKRDFPLQNRKEKGKIKIFWELNTSQDSVFSVRFTFAKCTEFQKITQLLNYRQFVSVPLQSQSPCHSEHRSTHPSRTNGLNVSAGGKFHSS